MKKKKVNKNFRIFMICLIIILLCVIVGIYNKGKSNLKKIEEGLYTYDYEEYMKKNTIHMKEDEQVAVDDLKFKIIEKTLENNKITVKIEAASENELVYVKSADFGYYIYDDKYNFIDYMGNEYIDLYNIKSPISEKQNIINYYFYEFNDKINNSLEKTRSNYAKNKPNHSLSFELESEKSKVFTININLDKKLKDVSKLYLCLYNITYKEIDENNLMPKNDAKLLYNQELCVELNKGE